MSNDEKPPKRRLRKVVLAAGFVLVFLAGLLGGAIFASIQYYRHVFSKLGDEFAPKLSSDIRTLSQLRLGETEAAIADLEQNVDGGILMIGGKGPLVSITGERLKALKAARTYRSLVPPAPSRAASITAVLKDVPEIEKSVCDAPLCRLIARRESEKETPSVVEPSPALEKTP